MKLSQLAETIQTSPIITLAAEINALKARGEKLFNLTIGDFDPKIFPIPDGMRDAILTAYRNGETNYPGAVGLPHLRTAVSGFLKHFGGIDYAPDDIFIGSGGRPFICSAYLAIVDPGDKVIFPVPSWNNDHYTRMVRGEEILLETTVDTNFMPTAEMIEPHLKGASLLALCSPQNPTGTVFSREGLAEICDLVIRENRSRKAGEKPLMVLFDQIYWPLTFGETRHHHPVNINPEMREYCVFIDGVSKSFSGTGVRVGWGFGPSKLIAKMRSIVAHLGAWAPRAEQVGIGHYLADTAAVESHLESIRGKISGTLEAFYRGFQQLKRDGFAVDAVHPQAAMYLTVKFDMVGKKTASGDVLDSTEKVHRYLINEAKVGFVPFSYFGASETSPWYRLSVGTCAQDEVPMVMQQLHDALAKLG